jgi:uncharacterized membrane protein
MKSPIIGPRLKRAALLLLLGSFIASVRSIQAAGVRTGSAEGYLLVCSATDEFSDGDLVFNAVTPEPHVLLSNIFGIKMHRIGMERR